MSISTYDFMGISPKRGLTMKLRTIHLWTIACIFYGITTIALFSQSYTVSLFFVVTSLFFLASTKWVYV